MIVAHTMNHMDHLLAMTDQIQAAGIMQTIRRAIFGFLAVVFFLGGLVGFFIGKAFGKRG